MTSKTTPLQPLRGELEHPTNGFVGVVDCLLKLGREYDLELEWRDEKCRVTRLDQRDNPECIEVRLSKPKVRSVLANIAIRSRISPYGGEGTLQIDEEPRFAYRVELTNTAGKQHVTLRRKQMRDDSATRSDRKLWAAHYRGWLVAACLLILVFAVIGILLFSNR